MQEKKDGPVKPSALKQIKAKENQQQSLCEDILLSCSFPQYRKRPSLGDNFRRRSFVKQSFINPVHGDLLAPCYRPRPTQIRHGRSGASTTLIIQMKLHSVISRSRVSERCSTPWPRSLAAHRPLAGCRRHGSGRASATGDTEAQPCSCAARQLGHTVTLQNGSTSPSNPTSRRIHTCPVERRGGWKIIREAMLAGCFAKIIGRM